MRDRYLIEDLRIEGQRIVVSSHPQFADRFLREDFWVEYDASVSLSDMENTLLAIPFLLNVLPLIWISSETFRVRRLDGALAASLEETREAFRALYPRHRWDGSLRADEVTPVADSAAGRNKAMLFSGGVDSVYSALRHRRPLELITILSSLGVFDWREPDSNRAAREYFERFAECHGHRLHFVASNLGTLISPQALRGIWPRPRFWLNEVQHGLGFAGITAPVLRARGVHRLVIAGCEADHYGVPYGSSPSILNAVRWDRVRAATHGTGKRRQEKIRFLLLGREQHGAPQLALRPCLRPTRQFKNCGWCAKCLQTEAGLLAEGGPLRAFGFDRPERDIVPDLIERFRRGRLKLPNLAELMLWNDIQRRMRDRRLPACQEDGVRRRADGSRFLDLALGQYYADQHGRLRRGFRRIRSRLGLALDSRPAIGRWVRRFLRRPA